MVGPSIVIAIAANKQDLRKQQVVSSTESEAYAASIGALHFSTSAKTGEGLQDIFQAIADMVVARTPRSGASQRGRPGGRLTMVDDLSCQPHPTSKSNMCC
ncbi:Ras- protein Rab-21 [Trebouxia sp. C0010 RCD-2024]